MGAFICSVFIVAGFVYAVLQPTLPLWIKIALVVFIGPIVAAIGIVGSMVALFKDRPACRCGRTDCDGYAFMGISEKLIKGDGAYLFRCPRCKREWALSDRVFYEILSGSQLLPFKEQAWHGRWRDPTSKAPITWDTPLR